jgi:membrane-associated phospholipid phosphatase
VSLFDSRLLADTRRLGNHTEMDRGSAIGNAIGGPGPIALGLALYAGGRVAGDGLVTTTGREVVRAVLVSGSLTALMKGAVGRSRPFASPGDADEYSPGHGFLNSARASFPSGHTSAAFAAATVLVREMNRTHARTRLILDPLLLSGATFVGFSRVYDQQHWPSDVVVGAALGAVTGYEVVAHAHGDRSRLHLGVLTHLVLGRRDHEMEMGWSIR